MGEGVDPTQMCQSLVDKVSRIRQLKEAADPEILFLFEEWLEELAEEVISLTKEMGSLEPAELSRRLGLPLSGAAYLLARLKREGRL